MRDHSVTELPSLRRQKILLILERDGKVMASELSQHFAVSEDTIRRDLAELERHLAADVLVVSDGGGVVTAARIAVEGRERVATFLHGIVTKQASDVAFRPVWANGQCSAMRVAPALNST